jgi:hypothetical protein
LQVNVSIAVNGHSGDALAYCEEMMAPVAGADPSRALARAGGCDICGVELGAAYAKISDLEAARRHDQAIATACGIVSERYAVSPETAVETLLDVSRRLGSDLIEVASIIIRTAGYRAERSAFSELKFPGTG